MNRTVTSALSRAVQPRIEALVDAVLLAPGVDRLLADPQIASRNILHKHENAPGISGSFTVPVAAFKFAHGGPKVDRPPPMFGQHNEEVLTELGYGKDDIARFKAAKVI